MPGDLFEFGLNQYFGAHEREKKIEGVTTGTVIDNVDITGEGRVQLMLPWLPGYQPWARVSTPMAGLGRGTYFIPQIGDEVLVAFHQGDVREPYIVGSLWNTLDRPPAAAPTDPVTKRAIRTPLGQEINFDEKTGSVTLSNTTMHSLTLDPTQATLGTLTASISMDPAGNVTITAAKGLEINASTVKISAGSITIEGGRTSLSGLAQCTIKGGRVDINPPA